MSSCGGSISTDTVTVSKTTAKLAVSQQDQRTRTTIRAAADNVTPVYITTRPAARPGEGFPLYPGEAYTFDDRGARVAIYVIGDPAQPGNDPQLAHIITEAA